MPATGGGRFVGVDLARLVAMLGMMAAHLWAADADAGGTEAARLAGAIVGTLSDGTASTAFAVIGGASLVFASVSVRRHYRRSAMVLGAVVRGLMVLVIGSMVALAPNIIVAVLVPFGAAMVIAAPFLLAPSWVLAVVAAVLGIGGGWLNALARASVGGEISSLPITQLVSDPLGSVASILLTGVYPVLTWLVYLLVGMLVARALLHGRAMARLSITAAWLVAAGAAAALLAALSDALVRANLATLVQPPMTMIEATEASAARAMGAAETSQWWAQLLPTPHSGTPADILLTGGLAVVTIGLLTLAFDAAGRSAARSWPVQWLRATGAAPLTIYTVHVLMTSLTVTVLADVAGTLIPDAPWFGIWLVQLLVIVLLGGVLAVLRRRGPLEWLVASVVRGCLRPLRSDAGRSEVRSTG